ncbi:MAG: substrate-binding domain-containing protein [Cyanobacteria bacterium J06635_10]
MIVYRWSFVGVIIAAFFLFACNSQNNSLSNNTKSENLATASSEKEEYLGIQTISSSSSPTPIKDEPQTGIKLPDVNPLKLGGQLRIGGSSTLYFLSKAIADRFIEEGYPGRVDIASAGTNRGFELFCSYAVLDIVSAYGSINNEQIRACNRAGIVPIGFQVAVDSLTVVVSSQNDFLPSNLSREDLKKILTFEKWSDVNKDWPSRAIQPVVQSGQWAGSSALFVRKILNGNLNQLINATNTKLYDFEEEVVQSALVNPDVIGIIGYAYYKQNKREVRAISIDGIAPSETKSYPFTSPMFIYTDTKLIRKRPEVQGFINFYLKNVDEENNNANSLPAEEAALNTSKLKLLRVLGRGK